MSKLLICTDNKELAKAVSGTMERLNCGVVKLLGGADYLEQNVLRVIKLHKPSHVLIGYMDFNVQRHDIVKKTGADRTLIHCGHPDRVREAKERGYQVYGIIGTKELANFIS